MYFFIFFHALRELGRKITRRKPLKYHNLVRASADFALTYFCKLNSEYYLIMSKLLYMFHIL